MCTYYRRNWEIFSAKGGRKKSRLEKIQVGILRTERCKICKRLFLWKCAFFSRRNLQLYISVFVYLVCLICFKDRVGLQSWNLSPVICPIFSRFPRSFRQQQNLDPELHFSESKEQKNPSTKFHLYSLESWSLNLTGTLRIWFSLVSALL